MTFSFTNKIALNFDSVHNLKLSYAQLMYSMLYAMHQKDQPKSTGTKDAQKKRMKLTPDLFRINRIAIDLVF